MATARNGQSDTPMSDGGKVEIRHPQCQVWRLARQRASTRTEGLWAAVAEYLEKVQEGLAAAQLRALKINAHAFADQGVSALLSETLDGKVTDLRAGFVPEVDYIEGCS